VQVYESPPWPCQCISASLWAPAQPTSQPGSWWPRGYPSVDVPAAPGSGGVCRRGGRHSSAAVPAVHSSPPPLPLLCLHTAHVTPGPGHTALAAENKLGNHQIVFNSVKFSLFCIAQNLKFASEGFQICTHTTSLTLHRIRNPTNRKNPVTGKKGMKPSGEQQRRIPLHRWTEARDVMCTAEQYYRVTTHSMNMTKL